MFGVFYLQSAYSMLKNTILIPDLVTACKQGGYDFVALADENLHGMLTLFNEAKKQGIKPVLGMKIRVTDQLEETDFLVYVKDQVGYRNLLKLNLLKHSQSEVSIHDLHTHQQGLIIITEGHASIIDKYILLDDLKTASSFLNRYHQMFNDFYIGLHLDTLEAEIKVAPTLVKLANELDLKVVPLHLTSYLNSTEKVVLEALVKIGDEHQIIAEDADFSFKNKVQLKAMFSEYPYIFNHLKRLIENITFSFDFMTFEMPKFPLNKGIKSKAYLSSLAHVGLKKRLKKISNPNIANYIERLEKELKIINDMGYDDYFLIVYDFVKFAKTNDILVGPGRGSAAGSLVAFCLGITDVDPLQYDLLFERFLNPERMSMPDIDLDFPDNKRDQVINYVYQKYGIEHIVSIVTFGTFALRSSIRDIARVMKIDISRVEGIIKSVINDTINPSDYETVRLLEVAKKIEGLPRHTGTHAAGVILAKQNLTQNIPLQKGPFDFYQSQLEASDLESLGLLKIDFLGIKNLTIIDEVVKMLEKDRIHIDVLNLPFDDQKTFELLSVADTDGIFQLESTGMKQTLRKLKPKTFEDIVAILALYRPGPMDNINEYISRRAGKSFDYPHPTLKPILQPTYGIIVYQEQIMRICHEFAGYTLAEADLLRRGISKKDKDILNKERIRFIEKCSLQNHNKQIAESIYDYIVKFADYGFNRSHSVAYAMIAYQMAYLKANHYPAFMTILLSNVIGSDTQTHHYIDALRKRNVKVLPPNINLSIDRYILNKNEVLMPLSIIRTIGITTVNKIIEVRKNGIFKNYQDLKIRLKKEINERNLEMLIHSGALDCFGINRHTLIENRKIEQAGYENYITDFKLKKYSDYAFSEKIFFEKEALGFNLVFSPYEMYKNHPKVKHLQQFEELEKQQQISALVFKKKVKEIKAKNGTTMAFLELDDGKTTIETTIFSDIYSMKQHILEHDVFIATIKNNTYQGRKSYVISNIEPLDKDVKGTKK
jgi:DNA polymerase III subunit alpha